MERNLGSEGTSRTQLGREGFENRIGQWTDKYNRRITDQMKRIGDSVDWSREKFTLSPDMSQAVTEVFVRLYLRGLIYRRACGRSFWQRLPGILPRQRATEPFRRSVCQKHFDGISRSRLGQRELISSATVERWFGTYLQQQAGERISRECPRILGIDEHFFTRRRGYATTFCDLRNRKVYDVALGRSETALESYPNRLEGKHLVEVVCMDLAAAYRSLVRKHFPQARRSLSCHPHRESSFPGLLEGS